MTRSSVAVLVFLHFSACVCAAPLPWPSVNHDQQRSRFSTALSTFPRSLQAQCSLYYDNYQFMSYLVGNNDNLVQSYSPYAISGFSLRRCRQGTVLSPSWTVDMLQALALSSDGNIVYSQQFRAVGSPWKSNGVQAVDVSSGSIVWNISVSLSDYQIVIDDVWLYMVDSDANQITSYQMRKRGRVAPKLKATIPLPSSYTIFSYATMILTANHVLYTTVTSASPYTSQFGVLSLSPGSSTPLFRQTGDDPEVFAFPTAYSTKYNTFLVRIRSMFSSPCLIHAFNTKLKEIWSLNTTGDCYDSWPPVVSDMHGLLFAAPYNPASVIAASLQTGKVQWQWTPPNPSTVTTIMLIGTARALVASVYPVTTDQATLFLLDPPTGRVMWKGSPAWAPLVTLGGSHVLAGFPAGYTSSAVTVYQPTKSEEEEDRDRTN